MAELFDRFEILLPPGRRAALRELSRELGVSASGLARLSILRLLQNPNAVLGGSGGDEHDHSRRAA